MTLLWFFVWLIWDLVGDEEALTFEPVNWWARRSTARPRRVRSRGPAALGAGRSEQ